MSRVVITTAVGPAGRALLAVTGPHLERYAARVGAAFRVIASDRVSPGYPQMAKWLSRSYFAHYDRAAVLDADVSLHPDCPDLFEAVPAGRVGFLDERPLFAARGFDPAPTAAAFRAAAAAQGWPGDLADAAPWVNSGVLVASRGHEGLFAPPERPMPAVFTAEQIQLSLNLARHGLPWHPLPESLNCQPWLVGPDWPAGTMIRHYAGVRQPERLARLRQDIAGWYPDRPLPADDRAASRRAASRAAADALPCPHRLELLQAHTGCCDAGGAVWRCGHPEVAAGTHGGRVTLTRQAGVSLDCCSECEFRPR